MSQSYAEADISEFGARERAEIVDLLTAYAKFNRCKLFTGPHKIGFNKNSGYVFLTDGDCNTAMEQDGYLYDFLTCPECGNEGLSPEFDKEKWCCKQYFEETGI